MTMMLIMMICNFNRNRKKQMNAMRSLRDVELMPAKNLFKKIFSEAMTIFLKC